MEEIIEKLAERAHSSWMESNEKNGITSRISSLTGEEQMVPYSELSEQVKEYDRAMVRGVLKDIDYLGYQIIKK